MRHIEIGTLAWRLQESYHPYGEHDPITTEHEIIIEWRHSTARSRCRIEDFRLLPSSDIRLIVFRIMVAVSGGLSLVVPMPMTGVHSCQMKNLVSTSAFVIGFGVSLATFIPQAEDQDMLASAAAYAAVLVLFLGVGEE